MPSLLSCSRDHAAQLHKGVSGRDSQLERGHLRGTRVHVRHVQHGAAGVRLGIVVSVVVTHSSAIHFPWVRSLLVPQHARCRLGRGVPAPQLGRF